MSKNTSGYRGVSWIEEKNKWRAAININKKVHFLGYFNKVEDAAEAYKIAMKENGLHRSLKQYHQKEYYKEYYKTWRQIPKNKEKSKSYGEIYRASRKDYRRRFDRDINRKIKIEVLIQYGNICECCGINNIDFLTLHHKNNDGGKHRKEVNCYGSTYYKWLKRNNYPKDLGIQVLCYNCNCAKEYSPEKRCPHEIELKQLISNEVLY